MAIDYKELRDLSAIILALAFGFSYKFSGPATLSNWSGNFLIVLILVAVSILIHEFAHQFVARQLGANVKPQLWLSGIIAMLLLLVLSNGLIVFAAIWAVYIIPERLMRSGRTWPHLGPKERSVIAVSGLLANLALAVVAKLLIPVLGQIATKLMTINLALAIFNLVPFFTLIPIIAMQKTKQTKIDAPYIEGEFVFFGSRTAWVFLFVFSVILAIGLMFLGALASVLLSVVVAILLFVAWHYFFEPEFPVVDSHTTPSFRHYK